MAQDLGERVMQDLLRILASDANNSVKMKHGLNLLARYRAREIGAFLFSHGGAEVRSGPFQGMVIHNKTSEGNVAPKILGSYEQELHGIIERCIATPYECVVNVGCGDGFYAIGFARRMPGSEIQAYDINDERRAFTKAMAEKNGVGERIIIGGECGGDELAVLAGRRVLLVCDIEGGERDFLDPAQIPALKGFDILVELHEVLDKALPEEIVARFAASHDTELIAHQGRDPNGFEELEKISQFDQWLAVWEGRQGPTPWAFMRAKSHMK
ncbi:MAG: hypothetical protein HOM52_03670 [Rhodospirillaceae bacterium]|jgi:hypothetical protein|nr:hypothetical protein [Rhodospirillaceae bacterium]MBT3925833.1 hypothetical protein [Rhodospirillaceae bacterium]MBT4428708.1 hypothetical protein [Rhodospirillaceae bacterium]MBT5037589.1 hypothetical protein [Rhodospirillaceae bacterium]